MIHGLAYQYNISLFLVMLNQSIAIYLLQKFTAKYSSNLELQKTKVLTSVRCSPYLRSKKLSMKERWFAE